MKSGKSGLVIVTALDVFLGSGGRCEMSARGSEESTLEAVDPAESSRGGMASCGAGPSLVSKLAAVCGITSMVWMGENDKEGDFGDMAESGGWFAGCEGKACWRLGWERADVEVKVRDALLHDYIPSTVLAR
jgi:hypothetical protein